MDFSYNIPFFSQEGRFKFKTEISGEKSLK